MNLHKIGTIKRVAPLSSRQISCQNGAIVESYSFLVDKAFDLVTLIVHNGRVVFVENPITAHTAVAVSFDGNYQSLYDMFEREIQEGR